MYTEAFMYLIPLYVHVCSQSMCSVVPGSVVVELVQQSVSQHSSVFIYEDVLTAIDADQQADDV